jgi:hypothetical protein
VQTSNIGPRQLLVLLVMALIYINGDLRIRAITVVEVVLRVLRIASALC